MQEEIHKRLHAPELGPCACSQVRRLARKLSSLYDTLLSPEDLTITQYSLLADIERAGQLSHAVLAEKVGMDRTTLTRNLLMPLVRIDLIQGKSSDYKAAIGEVIYEAMLAILKVPTNDRFQVITEHPAEGLLFDPTYLDIQRSSDCIFIQLTLNEGRSVEQKQRFYKAVADGLHRRLSLRREDVFVNLVEVTKEKLVVRLTVKVNM